MNDQQTINTLKGLVIDAVSRANSGHPGGAMSSMDFAYLLFKDHLQFDPEDPSWLGRDRFVLSAGHESMLIYSLLHASGMLEMDELKNFRKLGSKTPGHPENFLTPGVECTTGPLGQGAAMAVGFALAQKHYASRFSNTLFGDQKTWALLGDGCIQEDVTLGAASLAGHLGLNNMIWYYDQNRIQISGDISRSFSDDVGKVFEGFGFNIISCDGHDHAKLSEAIVAAKASRDKPTLIIGKTVIARGAASMEGSHKTHGAPLPADERKETKAKLGLPDDEEFYFPAEARAQFQAHFDDKKAAAKSWRQSWQSWQDGHPDAAADVAKMFGATPLDLPEYTWNTSSPLATRNAFGHLLEHWADAIPGLVGGSADLEPSNMTGWFAAKVGDIQKGSYQNRNIAFGVREFPMSAVCNGLALYGGLLPFDATFLAFSDYSRPALRLGALQRVNVIHEFSHDSFYLGEDGPTHQPIEQIMSLRMIPDFAVVRPADGLETEFLMNWAVNQNQPSAFCLSRQKVPFLKLNRDQVAGCLKGGYEVTAVAEPELTLVATGAEVHLALDVAAALSAKGEGFKDKVRVVSLPCWELFDQQDASYRGSVIPAGGKTVSIEAGCSLGWQKYTGADGLNIAIDHFGESGPAADLAQKFGFTPDQIVEKILGHWY